MNISYTLRVEDDGEMELLSCNKRTNELDNVIEVIAYKTNGAFYASEYIETPCLTLKETDEFIELINDHLYPHHYRIISMEKQVDNTLFVERLLFPVL